MWYIQLYCLRQLPYFPNIRGGHCTKTIFPPILAMGCFEIQNAGKENTGAKRGRKLECKLEEKRVGIEVFLCSCSLSSS